MDALAEVLSEFEWPAPYTLEDDLPDGIVMTFPKCHLYFSEGFESEMLLKFLSEDTGTEENLTLQHALLAIREDPTRSGAMLEPELIRDSSPFASLDKVKNGIRNLCTLVLSLLRPCLLGDFSWVALHKARVERQQ